MLSCPKLCKAATALTKAVLEVASGPSTPQGWGFLE